MNEREFHEKADKVFLKIEEWVEDIGEDIDIESQDGILTFILPNQHQVVLSRQTPLNEIWLAAKQGAYHFKYTNGCWVTQKGDSLNYVLAELFDQPIDEEVNLKDEN